MHNCQNKEHKKPCYSKNRCIFCGESTCSPNYAYHVCIKGPSCPECKIGFIVPTILNMFTCGNCHKMFTRTDLELMQANANSKSGLTNIINPMPDGAMYRIELGETAKQMIKKGMQVLPDVPKGMERKYYMCGYCKQVQAHDFVSYGLGSGVQWNTCLCELTGNGGALREITADEFYIELNKKEITVITQAIKKEVK